MSSDCNSGCLWPFILVLPLILILICILNHWWITLVIVLIVLALTTFGVFALILAGLRQQYGMDFMLELKDLILFFKRRGYKLNHYFGAGTSHPGVILSKEGSDNVKILLHSPLVWGRQYIEVFEDKVASQKWTFDKSNYSNEVLIEGMLSPHFGSATIDIDSTDKS